MLSKLILLTLAFGAVFASQILNGYYVKVARWRTSPGTLLPKNLDASLLTHLTMYFAEIDADGNVIVADSGDARIYDEFHYWTAEQNPNLKTLLSIGGWDLNTNNVTEGYFADVAADESKRTNFASSAVAFARKYKFDGVSLDWFFPTLVSQGGTSADKANYAALVTALRSAITAESATDPLILAITVTGNVDIADKAYDIPTLAAAVDFINVMTYDYAGAWDTKTKASTDYASMVDTMDYWLIQKAPKEKLLLSVTTFGRSFTVSDASSNAAVVGLDASGAGVALTASNTEGMVAYYEILTLSKATDAKTAVDAESGATVLTYNSNQWVAYDSLDQVTKKAQYAYDQKFGGVMMWSVDFDDFSNGYPLTAAVSQALKIDSSSGSTTTTTNSTDDTNSGPAQGLSLLAVFTAALASIIALF